jgi:Transposase DNA-binding/Transposase DDE domain
MDTGIFFPQSRADFKPELGPGQRYRHCFGDKRLAARYEGLLASMFREQSIVVNQFSKDKSEQAGYYRFLSNPKVSAPELIYESSRLDRRLTKGKDILVIQDSTSIGLGRKSIRKRYWQDNIGVIDDNCTPGFYVHCSLSIDRESYSLLGLGDLALYSRPLNTGSKEEKQKARTARRKLPIEQQESFVWALCASNSIEQLKESRRVTFVMDQGSDKYEVLSRILANPCAEALWRSKEDRQVVEDGVVSGRRLSDVLSALPWSPPRPTVIRSLNHYSKSNGKCVQRTGRTALIRVRYAKVYLALPSGLCRQPPSLCRPLYVVEAEEAPSTVPPGEEPIRWRLLTTWKVCSDEQAWEVVEAYQARWFIEQLFRILKKQGLCIEDIQLETVQSIKNQSIMAIYTSTKALQLTLARDGDPFIPIETMFDEEQQTVLVKLNKEFSGKTQKQLNPHNPKSLAWAAWVIARMGGWKGYASQRPPGPITMMRGVEAFEKIEWALRVLTKT